MELFQRKKTFSIEGIYIKDFEDILDNKNTKLYVSKILYDNIILNNGKRIKCIYNYYCNTKGLTIKKNNKVLICPKIQIIYDIENCNYYMCKRCHMLMINKLKKDEVELNK